MELVGQPGGAVAVEIPADSVRAVFGQGGKRIDRVALGLGHLVALSVQDKAQNNDVLIGRFIEKERGFRVQGIEPASGLVDRFGDELRGEAALEKLLVLKRIMILGERHGAGIEPAVDDFGDTLHGAAAVRTLDLNIIHERPVQLDIGIVGIAGQLRQFRLAADADLLAAVRAFPDVEGGAPVTVTGNAPVLDVLQPVAETAFADGLGNPVDLLVVADKVILDSGHFDEPGFSRVVKQRGIASPAVGIIMLKFRRVEQKASGIQVLKDFRIRADGAGFDLSLCRLAAHARERRAFLQASLLVDQLYKGGVILTSHTGIIFTEGGGLVNDTGTVCHGDIVIDLYKESLFMLTGRYSGRLFIKGDIFPVFQGLAGHGLQYLVLSFPQDLIQQGFRHVIGIAVRGLDPGIRIFRIDTEGGIGGQGPGCGRPCQEISVLIRALESYDRGAFLQCLIALGYFMRGKGGAAAGAVRHDLKALI